MSGSDQAASANTLRSFTTTQLRELLEGRLDGQQTGSLRNLVVSLRNTEEQPQTMGATGGAAAAPRTTRLSVVQSALAAQARATEDGSILAHGQAPQLITDLPSAEQLDSIRTLLRRHEMLYLTEQRRDAAHHALQRYDAEHPGPLEAPERAALMATMKRENSAFLVDRSFVEDARVEVNRILQPEQNVASALEQLRLELQLAEREDILAHDMRRRFVATHPDDEAGQDDLWANCMRTCAAIVEVRQRLNAELARARRLFPNVDWTQFSGPTVVTQHDFTARLEIRRSALQAAEQEATRAHNALQRYNI
ncbi:MAG: hypothetical protein ACRC9T_03030, partial [Vibrionaceae bacterium]